MSREHTFQILADQRGQFTRLYSSSYIYNDETIKVKWLITLYTSER